MSHKYVMVTVLLASYYGQWINYRSHASVQEVGIQKEQGKTTTISWPKIKKNIDKHYNKLLEKITESLMLRSYYDLWSLRLSWNVV